jgi:hypothetical protein
MTECSAASDIAFQRVDLSGIAETVEHNVAALGRQPRRNGFANAARGAGDKGCFTFQHDGLLERRKYAMLGIGPGSRRVTTIITQDYQDSWAEKSVHLSRRFQDS